MTAGQGITSRPHWWKVSALSTTLTLLGGHFMTLTVCVSQISNNEVDDKGESYDISLCDTQNWHASIKLRIIQDKFPLNKCEAKGDLICYNRDYSN